MLAAREAQMEVELILTRKMEVVMKVERTEDVIPKYSPISLVADDGAEDAKVLERAKS